MRYDLDQLKDLTSGVQDGLANQISSVQAQEREFMISRQTLGRPPMAAADTQGAGGASMVDAGGMLGGATIVTQFNRDNLDDDDRVAGNEEIDDLRRA